MNDEKVTARLAVNVEPSRKRRVMEMAKRPEYQYNECPSYSAVVRHALDLLFAEDDNKTEAA